MELPAWDEELIETLHRNGRGRLLKALIALGGTASVPRMFERSGVSKNNRTQFIGDLERRGLIRRVENARGGKNQRAHVYRLTGEGERTAENLMERQIEDPFAPEEPDEVGEIRSTLADLNRRVAHVERDIYGDEDGREYVRELREQIEELKARIDELGKTVGEREDQADGRSGRDSGKAGTIPGAETV
jgi:DNA-binding MarR family transcriptional regulator